MTLPTDHHLHANRLKQLPPDKVAELTLIVNAIRQTNLAELIILYGSYARGDFKDGKIMTLGGSRVQRRSDYDLLVVVNQPDETREIERYYQGFASPKIIGGTELEIRKQVRGLALPVQLIVEQIGEINRRLADKQYFYSDIKREGIVLYDTGKCHLIDLPDQITPTIRRQYAEDEFEGWFATAKINLEIANFTINQGKTNKAFFKQSAFHLEQVCEMCYKCVLLVYTHYAADEHDLYTLRHEAEKYESLLKTIFPLETQEQEKYFDKLNLAYIGARYIKTFTVEAHEVTYWKSQVERLLSVTQQTCQVKIEALKQIEREYKR